MTHLSKERQDGVTHGLTAVQRVGQRLREGFLFSSSLLIEGLALLSAWSLVHNR